MPPRIDSGRTIGLTAKPESITFLKRVRDRRDLSDLRDFNEHAGDFKRHRNADGSWDLIDFAGGMNTWAIDPPDTLKPLFAYDIYMTSAYGETQAYPGAAAGAVTIRFEREDPRDPEDTTDVLTETATADEWLLQFKHGTIATENLTATEHRDHDRIVIQGDLTFEQAEVILENPNYVNAVSIEEIPDWVDFARDNNPNDRNTVTITRPANLDATFLPHEGDYGVTDYTLGLGESPQRWSLNMNVMPLKDTVPEI